MIYNDRVILINEKKVDDFLGERLVKSESLPIPCMKNTLTDIEQKGMFGKYQLDRFKLHLQGIYDDFSEIKYHGKIYKIAGKKYHKNSTVIYI